MKESIYRCPKCYNKILSTAQEEICLCASCHLQFAKKDYDFLRRKYLNINTKDIDITENASHLTMVYKWEKKYFLLFFSLFWCYLSFSFVWASFDNTFEEGVTIVYPLFGVLLLYWSVATFVNSTSVVVTQNHIRVSSSPLPWPGLNTDYQIRNIEQLYVEKYVSYHQNKTPVHRYKIVLKEPKKQVNIVRGIERYEQAVTLENYIERFLDIQDKPVDKEHTT